MAGKKQHIDTNDDQYYKRLGERIKKLRKAAGYNSYDLFAFEIHMSRSQYANYEKGMDMRLSTLRRLAEVHGITVDELLKGI
jgi:transcriptional regulator with XRE-family HTH domain